MKIVPAAVVVACSLVLGVSAADAQLFNLTGHWTGTWSCKGVANDGKFTIANKTSTLDITQAGQTFAATVDAADPIGNFSFNLFAVPDIKKPDQKGEVIALGCALANTVPPTDVAEFARAQVQTKPNSFKASFKASSIFTDIFNGDPEVGSCKYSYKRIDTNDPGVSNCP